MKTITGFFLDDNEKQFDVEISYRVKNLAWESKVTDISHKVIGNAEIPDDILKDYVKNIIRLNEGVVDFV